MRNRNVVFPVLVFFGCLLTLIGCEKADSTYYNYENTIKQFDGNALDYLKSQSNGYDSLLLVLDRLPAISDSLRNEELTVFAVTDKSFEISIGNLNKVRKTENKSPLYLADIDVLQLDTLMCRYLIKGRHTTADLQPFVDGLLVSSISHGYPMHILYNKANASGFVGGGPQILTYSDTKRSIFVKFWERSATNAVNIGTKNAIINVVAPGHDFGFGDFIKRVNN